MARHNQAKTTPQHDRIKDRKKHLRLISATEQHVFGINRPLEPQTSRNIVNELRSMQLSDDIPRHVKLHTRLAYPVLLTSGVRKQIMSGVAFGFSLHELQQRASKEPPHEYGRVSADITGARVSGGKRIELLLSSDALKEEQARIAERLEALGLKGMRRPEKFGALALSLGVTNKRITPTEERHIEHAIPEALNELEIIGSSIEFEAWVPTDHSELQ